MDYPRRTKIMAIRQEFAGGEIIRIGDLVWASSTSTLVDGEPIEGQVVDIVRGKVVIDVGESPALWTDGGRQRYSYIYANHVDLVACCKAT